VLVNDATLQLLVELRPATAEDLASVSGFGAAALLHYGQPLLQVRTRLYVSFLRRSGFFVNIQWMECVVEG
jgi:hypothetical protein